jgi:GT2 family glycosyltransferase
MKNEIPQLVHHDTRSRTPDNLRIADEPPVTGVTLSIVIPNYNARELLRDCLESIRRNPCKYPYEIFVIDDASQDDSYGMVKKDFPEVHLLRNEKNLSYGRSNNRCFEKASGRYIYMLNNDTIMLPEALDKMVEFLDAHPKAGAVSSKLLNEDKTVQFSVKNLPNILSGLFGARSIVTRLFPNNPFTRKELLHMSRDMSQPFMAGYVSSASLMVRREVIKIIGGLDPRLTYHVDADYCARIWKAGWQVYYLPDSVVIHLDHRGGTLVSPRRRLKAIWEFHRGSFIFYKKHLMHSWWSPMTLLVTVGLSVRFVFSLLLQPLREISRKINSR